MRQWINLICEALNPKFAEDLYVWARSSGEWWLMKPEGGHVYAWVAKVSHCSQPYMWVTDMGEEGFAASEEEAKRGAEQSLGLPISNDK